MLSSNIAIRRSPKVARRARGDPELEFLQQEYRAEFKAAFEEAVRSLSDREHNLLRMHVLEHLPIDDIGAVFKIHRATAARQLSRAREVLREGTRQKLRERLRLSEAELRSVLKLVRSNLELSLSRVFAPERK